MGLTFDQQMDGFTSGYQTGKQVWEESGLPPAPSKKGKNRTFSYARAQVAPLPMSMQLAGPPTLDDLKFGRITVSPAVAYAGGGYGGGGSATNGELVGFEIEPKLLYAGAALLLLFLFAKRRKKKG